ncbi:MAG: hypothetical protein GX051_06065 [Clostridiales bacterium]|nr:hypothetical protein [Clostridiales bacterium]
MFRMPVFNKPDFNREPYLSSPDVSTAPADDGWLPFDFYATTIFPEYFKINGEWKMITESRMDSCVVIRDGVPCVIEPRNIKKGEQVVINRTDDGTAGIYVHSDPFSEPAEEEDDEEDGSGAAFAFRTGKSRESSYSRDYDRLYDILRHDRDNGYIVWVLGPACVFDHDSRRAMANLINNGYCDALFAGNALATHDLEAAIFNTGLGQDIYTKKLMKNGHYNHLHTINLARAAGSLPEFVKQKKLDTGVISALVKNDVPFVLAGSIRDDGPLPGVIANVYESQDAMRAHTRKATTVIALATQLHTIATGNMTPSYQLVNGEIRPVFFYSVDISEFAVNKLHDRGSLSVNGIVTNIQDFLVNAERNLVTNE